MATLVTDPYVEEAILAQRRAMGGDAHDEVWDGVYMMTPIPNVEHQALVMGLAFAFKSALGADSEAQVFTGINLSDREDDWEHNYRVPDVAVYLPTNAAKNCSTHWRGGPDLAVEILSPGDRAREKLPFYAHVATREILLVDRQPWAIELWINLGGRFELRGRATVDEPQFIVSDAMLLRFRLIAGAARPQIEVTTAHGAGRWMI